jgi:hypothetical protein
MAKTHWNGLQMEKCSVQGQAQTRGLVWTRKVKLRQLVLVIHIADVGLIHVHLLPNLPSYILFQDIYPSDVGHSGLGLQRTVYTI